MEHVIKITEDGSPTIYLPALNEHYHSIHGAYQESMHVFILAGLKQQLKFNHVHLHILEIGLGTGLNVLLTLREVQDDPIHISYQALEPYPLPTAITDQLDFSKLVAMDRSQDVFNLLHKSAFNQTIPITPHFNFIKYQTTLELFIPSQKFNLIYFDAFGPQVQPGIWSPENFIKLFEHMQPNGTLVTYCAKGSVRRAMQAAGFRVERLAGPPGKREMLRATKLQVISKIA